MPDTLSRPVCDRSSSPTLTSEQLARCPNAQVEKGEVDVIVALTEGLVLKIAQGSDMRLLGTYVASPLCWAVSTAGPKSVRGFHTHLPLPLLSLFLFFPTRRPPSLRPFLPNTPSSFSSCASHSFSHSLRRASESRASPSGEMDWRSPHTFNTLASPPVDRPCALLSSSHLDLCHQERNSLDSLSCGCSSLFQLCMHCTAIHSRTRARSRAWLISRTDGSECLGSRQGRISWPLFLPSSADGTQQS